MNYRVLHLEVLIIIYYLSWIWSIGIKKKRRRGTRRPRNQVSTLASTKIQWPPELACPPPTPARSLRRTQPFWQASSSRSTQKRHSRACRRCLMWHIIISLAMKKAETITKMVSSITWRGTRASSITGRAITKKTVQVTRRAPTNLNCLTHPKCSRNPRKWTSRTPNWLSSSTSKGRLRPIPWTR